MPTPLSPSGPVAGNGGAEPPAVSTSALRHAREPASGVERVTLDSLRREAILIAILGLGGLAFPGRLLGPAWLAGAVALWAFAVAVLYRGLADNRSDANAPLARSIGWASLLTLQRGWLLSVTAGFLFLPEPSGWLAWAPALAYSFAALLDHADGRLARRLGVETGLGARLDMELDAAGVLVATTLSIGYGKLPAAYLAIGLARYAFTAGIAWRRRRGLAVRPLHPSELRRWLAGFQMGFLAAALWPLVPAEASQLASIVFGASSLLLFGRDWLVVSNRLDPSSPAYAGVASRFEWMGRRAALAGKIAAPAGFALLILQGAPVAPRAMGILGAISIASGLRPRAGAFLLLAASTLVIGSTGASAVSAATLVASVLVLLFDADG